MNGLQAAQLTSLLALPLATFLGYSMGRRRAASSDATERELVGTMQAALFGLVGLLLAFSASMAQDRFVARRELILAEANAIGTAYLRSRYVDEPHASALAGLFREYVDARIAFYDSGADRAREDVAAARGLAIHQAMWRHVVEIVHDGQPGHAIDPFVLAMNAMFDAENARWVAVAAHVPAALLWLLFATAVVAVAETGYQCGINAKRSFISLGVVPLLLGLAVVMTLDLDSPRIGFIGVGQATMYRLRAQLAEDAESAADR